MTGKRALETYSLGDLVAINRLLQRRLNVIANLVGDHQWVRGDLLRATLHGTDQQ